MPKSFKGFNLFLGDIKEFLYSLKRKAKRVQWIPVDSRSTLFDIGEPNLGSQKYRQQPAYLDVAPVVRIILSRISKKMHPVCFSKNNIFYTVSVVNELSSGGGNALI